MARIIKAFTCICLMVLFAFMMHDLYFEFGVKFGEGLFFGIMLTTGLHWIAWKINPQAY